MGSNTSPRYPASAGTACVKASTANISLGGGGTLATVKVAGTNGSLIYQVWVKALQTTTSGTIRLFAHDGSTNFLIDETAVTALTPSATVSSWSSKFQLTDDVTTFILPAGWTLKASTHIAEEFAVTCFCGDF